MPTGIYIRTEQARINMSNSHKGQPSWNKGKKIDKEKYPHMGHHVPHSEESCKKMSESHKKNPRGFWLGKKRPKHTEDWKMKMSEKMRGRKMPPFSDEWKKNLRISHLGKISYWRGKKRPKMVGELHPNWKAKIEKACVVCQNIFEVSPSHEAKKSCSKECISIYQSKTRSGENCAGWKGGVTKIAKIVRNSGAYMEWRRTILERDNFSCLICSVHGGKLNVDHFPKTFSEIMYKNTIDSLEKAINCNELWETSNGRTLCEPCHKLTPTYLRNPKRSLQQET